MLEIPINYVYPYSFSIGSTQRDNFDFSKRTKGLNFIISVSFVQSFHSVTLFQADHKNIVIVSLI